MAQRQIAARISGDDYQARFFWYQAAQLLYADSRIEKVIIEHDEACHIDDIAVYFKAPGRRDSAHDSAADFFQVKYHVPKKIIQCKNDVGSNHNWINRKITIATIL